jgi:hypothetical protein
MDSRTGEDEVWTGADLLYHVIDMDWMLEAYRLTRRDGTIGING